LVLLGVPQKFSLKAIIPITLYIVSHQVPAFRWQDRHHTTPKEEWHSGLIKKASKLSKQRRTSRRALRVRINSRARKAMDRTRSFVRKKQDSSSRYKTGGTWNEFALWSLLFIVAAIRREPSPPRAEFARYRWTTPGWWPQTCFITCTRAGASAWARARARASFGARSRGVAGGSNLS
jgi:hypothetical protein